jgi:hypothetical protein
VQAEGRPLIWINATDIGNGSVFRFTRDRFGVADGRAAPLPQLQSSWVKAKR